MDAAAQRHITVAFSWAHDLDVGTLRVRGSTMGRRYATLWAAYGTVFEEQSLAGLTVLEIGAANGAAALLYAALGARRVVAAPRGNLPIAPPPF